MKKFAREYDYTHYTDDDFYSQLKELKLESRQEDNTFNVDIKSFGTEALEPVWKIVDEKIRDLERIHTLRAETTGKDSELQLLQTGKWEYVPDGRLVPKIANPVVLGGVHGDETSLLKQVGKAFLNETESAGVSFDRSTGFYELRANPLAIEAGERYMPDSQGEADMERVTTDPETARIKERLLSKIGKLPAPFVLNCHNDNAPYDPEVQEKTAPYGAVIDAQKRHGDSIQVSPDLRFKIELAKELGLSRLLLVEPEAAQGRIITEIKKVNPKAEGMIIEVNQDDQSNASIKIALRFMERAHAINEGRPSAALQVDHTFKETLIPRNDSMKFFSIFRLEYAPELKEGLTIDAGALYFFNPESEKAPSLETPIRIVKMELIGDALQKVAMTEEDKRLFIPA